MFPKINIKFQLLTNLIIICLSPEPHRNPLKSYWNPIQLHLNLFECILGVGNDLECLNVIPNLIIILATPEPPEKHLKRGFQEVSLVLGVSYDRLWPILFSDNLPEMPNERSKQCIFLHFFPLLRIQTSLLADLTF